MPTRLAFASSPTNGQATNPLSPTPQIQVLNGDGTRAMAFSGPVTLTLAAAPQGAVLEGNVTVNAVNGVAVFPGLRIRQAGSGYQLAANAAGLAAARSSPFNITPGAFRELRFSQAPPAQIAPSTPFNVTIEAVDAEGNRVDAGGNVTLTLFSELGAELARVTTPLTGGTATFNLRIDGTGRNLRILARLTLPNGLTTDLRSGAFQVTLENDRLLPQGRLLLAGERSASLWAASPQTLQGFGPFANAGSRAWPLYDPARDRYWNADSFTFEVVEARTLRNVAGTLSNRTDLHTSTQFAGFALDERRRRIYYSNHRGLFIFDADTLAQISGPLFEGRVTVGGIAYDFERDQIFLLTEARSSSFDPARVLVLDGQTLQPKAGSPIVLTDSVSQFTRLLFDDRNDQVYVTGGRLEVLDAVTLTNKGRRLPTAADTRAMDFDRAGNRLFVADFRDSRLYVVDAASLQTVTNVSAGNQSPQAVVFDPISNRIFINHFNGRGVEVLNGTSLAPVPGSPIFPTGTFDSFLLLTN